MSLKDHPNRADEMRQLDCLLDIPDDDITVTLSIAWLRITLQLLRRLRVTSKDEATNISERDRLFLLWNWVHWYLSKHEIVLEEDP